MEHRRGEEDIDSQYEKKETDQIREELGKCDNNKSEYHCKKSKKLHKNKN